MASDNPLVALAHRLGWDCTGDEGAVTVDSLAEWVRELEMRARQSVAPNMTAIDHLIAALALEPPADAAAMLRALRGFAYRLEVHARQQVADAGEAMWTVNHWLGRVGAYVYFGAVIQRLLDGAPVDDLGQATDLPTITDPIRETLTPDQMDAIERVMTGRPFSTTRISDDAYSVHSDGRTLGSVTRWWKRDSVNSTGIRQFRAVTDSGNVGDFDTLDEAANAIASDGNTTT